MVKMPLQATTIPDQDIRMMITDSLYPEKKSPIDEDISEISHRIMVELETASSQDLSEARYAKKITIIRS
jgi:hypothetical protein